MENKLEQLLNSLIKRGRVSFGDYDIAEFDQIGNTFVASNYESKVIGQFNIRQLVSKESGLWQFVCENNLNYSEDDSIYNVWLKHYAEDDHESPYTYASPVWYLIESALRDESELEDFLIQNINVDEKD